MSIGQESYVLPPWDEEGGQTKWAERARGALKRANVGYMKPDLSQRELPFGNETVLRILTVRFGERFQHFFNDPTDADGGLTSANCCAPAEFQGPRDDICPICAYAKNRGDRDHGGADLSHVYYLIIIKGKYQTIIVRDASTGKDTPQNDIVWEKEPLVFECTSGVFNSVYRYNGDLDFPPEANGDITKYAFRINKIQGKTNQQTRYESTPLPKILPKPDIPIDAIKEKWDFIRRMCQPTSKEDAARKLGLEISDKTQQPAVHQPAGSSSIGADFDLETPASTQKPTRAEPVVQQQAAPNPEDLF